MTETVGFKRTDRKRRKGIGGVEKERERHNVTVVSLNKQKHAVYT